MKKKEVIKLLIVSIGLEPFEVKKYKVKGGAKSKSAWRGKGINSENDVVIDFAEKEGFKDAVKQILVQAKSIESSVGEVD